jgi:hypothetical protein
MAALQIETQLPDRVWSDAMPPIASFYSYLSAAKD